MKINVINLKSEIKKLTKLINEYEEIYLNLYNELSTSSNYWQDNNSKFFFENINIEKLQTKTTLTELQDVKNIYEYLIIKYEEFGNKIEVIPESKTSILTKFDNYIDNLEQTIELYQQINLKPHKEISKKILNHINRLIQVKNNTIALKEKIKKYYEKLEEIEKEVNFKISKLKIEYIKETDINRFI